MIPDRSHILTEQVHPGSAALGSADPAGIVALMNAEHAAVGRAMEAAAPALAAFISAVEPGFAAGGRLVYVGAGTSGRLAVLDASEVGPTFCVGPDRVIGIIAGGDRCLREPSEGAEDDPAGALPELARLTLRPGDALLGIAAGGTTPYVHGAIAAAAAAGAVTGLFTCAPVPAPPGCAHLIIAPTGPEVLTGSTRLKAGTATKLVLNTISTALFARTGHVHGNLMVDVRATNAKLRDRSARIVMRLAGGDRDTAFARLDAAGGSAKLAVAMAVLGLDRSAATARLAAAGGRLAAVLPAQPLTSPG
jgi:N-acetylmuramic acid 6-phosphate etherase